jgi:hypothetical protein
VAVVAKDTGKAKELLDLLADNIEEHEQDLIIADSSPHGWLTVSKLCTTKELPKELRRQLAAIERDLAVQKTKRNGGPGKKFGKFSQQSGESSSKGPERKYSPEEAMFAAAKQIRTGKCSYCQKNGHFFRECPDFWGKVNQSREVTSKNSES